MEGLMKHWLSSILAAISLLAASAPHAAFHLFTIEQLYSNADGTVQFIVMSCAGCPPGENFWAGQSIASTHAGATKTFTFPNNLPSTNTSGKKALIGTQGFAALGLIAPDYTISNGFLATDGGTVNYAFVDQMTYSALPTDGTNALYRNGSVAQNLATNFAGASASVVPVAPPTTVNYQGLWWAAGGTESGWGINFAHSGDNVFATWYTYDTTGRAWWLSMLAGRTTPTGNAYAGPILATAGPPFNSLPFPPVTAPPTQVGSGTLTFTSGNNGSFAYTVNMVSQTKALERYDLFTGPQPTCTYSATTPNFAAATNYQDLWWVANGVESGWGVNFAHQGNSVFATWYTYDVDGAPLWLSVLAGRVGATNAYAGPLLRTSGPRFDAFDTTQVVPVQVGTATLSFANGNSATFNYVTSGSGGLPAVNQTKSIVRFPFAATGGTLCQ
jgi:hypothetical protein